MKTLFYKKLLFAVLVLTLFFTACEDLLDEASGPGTTESTFNLAADKRNVMTVTNLSSSNAALTFKYSLGRTAAVQPQSAALRSAALRKSAAPRKDLEAASRFNANPPLVWEPPSRAAVEGPRSSISAPGDGKSFWVTDIDDNFCQIYAVLRKQNTKCNIWVDENCFAGGSGAAENIITAANATALADKFDQIYPLATNLLGYEYGGRPGGDGGIDKDPRIQILVYGIADENVIGYFWGKDEYTQAQLSSSTARNLKSNEAEIFYIAASWVRADPESVYSTLIHEFQHMINFNQKALGRNLTSETWYDEMLAMSAEDVISPLIGIGPTSEGHPIKGRIPLFLAVYPLRGVDQWQEDDVIISYSNAYAFGAYLIRNYGGPKLIKEMLDNNAVNHNSVTQALRTVNGDTNLSFETALERYAEALLYSPANTSTVPGDKKSFNRSQTFALNGTSYTAAAFDIWTMQMPEELYNQYKEANYLTQASYRDCKGPVIFPLFQAYEISGHSVRLHRMQQNNEDITGDLKVTLTMNPGNANVKMGMVSWNR
jgi:hypothetical protein